MDIIYIESEICFTFFSLITIKLLNCFIILETGNVFFRLNAILKAIIPEEKNGKKDTLMKTNLRVILPIPQSQVSINLMLMIGTMVYFCNAINPDLPSNVCTT